MRKLGSRYVLHELLGQGTTGQVWRGAHVSDDAAVAIKVLRPELADDPEIVDRFLREWDLLVDLDSPDLVAVRDLVNEPDVLAIVMDLVDGPDLRSHLREFGPRPAEEAVRLAVGTLWALDSVHAAGIVHRDVKPENILIDTSDPDHPIVRLTDFGIARVINTPARLTGTGPIGTPLYMAPELGTGAPPTPAADVYAAGVVLYELLAGSPPFDSPNPAELLRAHREDSPLPIQGVPGPVWDVLAGMLAKSPRQRPASAADAAEDLVEALEAGQRAAAGRPRDRDSQAAESAGARSRGPAGAAAPTGAFERRDSDHQPATTGTRRVVRPAAAGASATAAAAAGTTATARSWSDPGLDLEHTQIAGSLTAASAKAPGWAGDAEHTRIAPATTAGRAGWNADAPTGFGPAVRVPARTDAPAADTNTVMSAIPASRQPGPSGAGSPAGSRAAGDRRRRTRIAAGAGLVVALVAGAGGWALASGGDSSTALNADGTTEVSSGPNTTGSSFAIAGSASPGVAVGVGPATTVPGVPGARPGSPGSPAPGTTPSAGATAAATTPASSPTAGSSPSPSPTDNGTAVVPNTEGSSYNAAKNTLNAAGFTNVNNTFDCYDSGAVDAVVQQSPNSGRIAKTTTIKLQIQGSDCRQVPNVAGMTEAGAKSTLSAAGFPWVNGSCPTGYTSKVLSYSPNSGRYPSNSTTISLNLSCTAPPPTQAPAPTATPKPTPKA